MHPLVRNLTWDGRLQRRSRNRPADVSSNGLLVRATQMYRGIPNGASVAMPFAISARLHGLHGLF